jgi:DNA-binding response OmpR family regulator
MALRLRVILSVFLVTAAVVVGSMLATFWFGNRVLELSARGFTINIAPNIATALEAIGREEFDLFLCDLGLPDGNGIDFIRKVRETWKTPAIALTGFGMQEDVERSQKAGFDAHLTKPVNLQRLEATMWRLLRDRP